MAPAHAFHTASVPFDARQSAGIPRGEIGERIDAETVRFTSGCELRVAQDASGVGRAEITRCEVDEPFIILLRALLRNRTQPYFMIPATLYGTNNAGRGVVANHPMGTGGDPKLAYRAESVDGLFSHSWHFRADHAAVPSVSATFDGRFVGLAVEDACAVAVDFMIGQLPNFQWTGSVVLVKDGKVYVNRGTREGVAVGQTFTVGEVEVLRDPDTGEVLDESMTEVARLTVSQVKEKLSICDVTSGDAAAVAKGMTIHQP